MLLKLLEFALIAEGSTLLLKGSFSSTHQTLGEIAKAALEAGTALGFITKVGNVNWGLFLSSGFCVYLGSHLSVGFLPLLTRAEVESSKKVSNYFVLILLF